MLWCDGRRMVELPPGARIEVTRGSTRCGWPGCTGAPFTDRLVDKFDLPVSGLARWPASRRLGWHEAELVIEELRIRGLGVIGDAVLELGPGLTVVTGETGAGKTMVVTSLGLLLGARADAGGPPGAACRRRRRLRVDPDGPRRRPSPRRRRRAGRRRRWCRRT